jgi:hypothetical protein
MVRSLFPESSARTQARHILTLKLDQMLKVIGAEGGIEQAIAAATRPNGSLNVAKMLRLMGATTPRSRL